MNRFRFMPWLSLIGAAVLIVVLAVDGAVVDRPTLSLLTMTLAWVTLAHTWNIFGGYSGYFDLGQVAFVGVGAYTAGLVITQLPTPLTFAQALVTAMLIGAGAAAVMGWLVLRLRGAVFTLATLGLLALIRELVQGTPFYFAPPYPTPNQIYNVVLLLCASAFLASIWVYRSQFGLMLRAIHADETGASARGINTLVIKLVAYTLVGSIAAGVGAVRAYWQGLVTPSLAFPEEGLALVLAITFIGGVGHPWGPIVGGLLFYIVQQLVPNTEVQFILAGAALLVGLFVLPQGILGKLRTTNSDPLNWTASNPTPLPIALSSERITELLTPPSGIDARVVLEGRSITHDFGGLRVVNKASFWVRRGEIVGLLGPNGAGKSTLLDCIAGILKPTSGEIFLNGQDITRLNPWQVNRYGLARTFERTRLFADLTVHENMLLACKWQSVPLSIWMSGAPAATHRRAAELLTLLGIGDMDDLLARDLGTTEQRLLEIGMALMSEPSIILLDEITAGIPLTTAGDIKTTIRQLNRDFGLTFFIIEHNINFAVDLCHRVYVLDHGSIVAEGAPQDIRHEPAVADAYFGHE